MSSDEKVNILLVDDQPQKLLSYEAVLGPLDENLLRASSAREALEILLKQDIAVILVDVVMPEMDGFEFARIVRDHPRFKNVPMIFVTAISTADAELVQGYALGAVDYVCVPVVPQILLAKVSVFIDLYRKTREILELNRTLEDRIAVRTQELEQALKVAEGNARRLEQEIVERQHAQQAIVDADRRKDEFLATLAHELRNPLAPLANSLELMKGTALVSGEFTQLREIMERQVTQLRRLVDDLLDVSRITRNKIDIHPSPIDLWTVVMSALESSRPMIDAGGHELFLHQPATPIWVNADRIRLTQVISNLLNNAARYTERGGRIWVACEIMNHLAEIRVKNTGIGISSEALQHVFDMFTRADTSLTRERDGLGIGLPLVKKLVELHGGSVEAASAGPEEGSEFTVRLPVCKPEQPAGGADAASSHAGLPRYHALVVDDTRASAHLVSRLLLTLGQNVDTAHDGPSALAAIDRRLPELVISDIGMPRMDGYELARRIRARPDCEGIRLVALTGYGQEQDRSRAYEAGFDEHLIKPVSLANLQELLHSMEQHRRAPVQKSQPAAMDSALATAREPPN